MNTNSIPALSKSKNVFVSALNPTSWNSLSVVARGLFPPAPFTKTSTVPRSLFTASRTASNDSFSSTFVLYAFAIPPSAIISSANFCAASSFKSSKATFAPCLPKLFASSPQITPPAPVMTTTLFVKSKNCVMFFSPIVLHF